MKFQEWRDSLTIGKNGCYWCIRDNRDVAHQNFHYYGELEGGHCFSALCGKSLLSKEYKEEYGFEEVELEEFEYMATEWNEEVHNALKENTGTDGKGYRGIRTDISRSLGVRFEYSQEDGSVDKVFYPITKGCMTRDIKDSIVAYKIRKLPKTFLPPVGEANNECDLFMQWKFKTHRGMLLVAAGECYSDDTEVLTGTGWKLFKNLSEGDVVAQHKSGKLEFVKPLSFLEKEYRGVLKNYKGSRVDILVTPNHKMVATDQKGGDYNFLASEGVRSKIHHLRVAGKLDGEGIPLTDSQIRFIVALTADAKVDARANGVKYVHFSFTKDRKVERLLGLLGDLGLEYRYYAKGERGSSSKTDNDWHKRYASISLTLPEWCEGKGFPKEWLIYLSYQQRKLILDELVYWDGCVGGGSKSYTEFSSAKADEADFIQAISATAGVYTSNNLRENKFGKWYRVNVCHNKDMVSYQGIRVEDVEYEGKVYCVTVPSGEIVVRRNNKVAICGNCDSLSAYQMLLDNHIKSGNDKKYDEIAVVSGITGEGGTASQLRGQYEWLNQFSKILICMDNDAAGRKATEQIAQVLPKGKAFVIPLRLKDVNEYLEKGMEREFISDFWAHKAYTPVGVVGSSSLMNSVIESAQAEKIKLPPFMHKLEKLMAGGIPLGVIVNLGSASGQGKSTFVEEITYYLIFNSDYVVGVLSLESDSGEYGTKLLSRHVGKKINLIETVEEKVEFLQSEFVQEKSRELFKKENGQDRFYLMDERGGSLDQIKESINKMIVSCGCHVIVLDPLQDVIASLSQEDQEKFMEWQKMIVKTYKVTFININHVRKSGSGKEANSTGADISEEDFHGSSSIFKSAACNLLFTRNKESESSVVRNTTIMKMTKCRWTGNTSPVAGKYYYDNLTHKLHDYDEWAANNPHMISEDQ